VIPIVAIMLALVGAPASTTVQCAPLNGYDGWTEWDVTPIEITLTPEMCLGLGYLEQSQHTLAQMTTMDPGIDVAVARSALILLHEASHAAGYRNETDTECHALSLLPMLVWQEGLDPAVLDYAYAYDRNWSDAYHQHECLPADARPISGPS